MTIDYLVVWHKLQYVILIYKKIKINFSPPFTYQVFYLCFPFLSVTDDKNPHILCIYNVLNKKIYTQCVLVIPQMLELRNIIWLKQSQWITVNTHGMIFFKAYEVPLSQINGSVPGSYFDTLRGLQVSFWGGGSRVLGSEIPDPGFWGPAPTFTTCLFFNFLHALVFCSIIIA